MSAITEPIRVNSFSELKKGQKIWSINRNGMFEIIEFVATIDSTLGKYSIFINMSKDGMPKFYEGRLKDEKWYRYTDNPTIWYHIYYAQAKYHEEKARNYREDAEWKKNEIEGTNKE